jgi:hypothetical protein
LPPRRGLVAEGGQEKTRPAARFTHDGLPEIRGKERAEAMVMDKDTLRLRFGGIARIIPHPPNHAKLIFAGQGDDEGRAFLLVRCDPELASTFEALQGDAGDGYYALKVELVPTTRAAAEAGDL